MSYLENHTLKLRAPEPRDLELLYQWENDSTIWMVSNTLSPFSRSVLQKYLNDAHLDIFQMKQQRFMIELKNTGKKTIGTIDLFDYDPLNRRAGIGILIADINDRKKGYASMALNLITEYCFNHLNFRQLYCNITTNNTDSIHLFTHKGFTISGEKKDWIKTPAGWQNELFLQLINPSSS